MIDKKLEKMYEQVNHLENPLTPNQVLLLKKVVNKFKSKVKPSWGSSTLRSTVNFHSRSELVGTPDLEETNLRCCLMLPAGVGHHGPRAPTPWQCPVPPRSDRKVTNLSGKLPGGSSSGKPQSKCWEYRV